jgi:hypothetical protein
MYRYAVGGATHTQPPMVMEAEVIKLKDGLKTSTLTEDLSLIDQCCHHEGSRQGGE